MHRSKGLKATQSLRRMTVSGAIDLRYKNKGQVETRRRSGDVSPILNVDLDAWSHVRGEL